MIATLRRAGVRSAFSLLPLLLAFPVFAGPDDIVPRGSVTYDLLGSLAAAGRLPGWSLSDFQRGDRLYSRREIARLLAKNAARLQEMAPDSPFAAFRRTLFVEFAPELRGLGVSVPPNSAPPAIGAESAGTVKVQALSGPAQGSGTVRLALTLPVGRDGTAVISGGNWREEWYRRLPSASRPFSVAGRVTQGNDRTGGFALPITGTQMAYPGIENAYLRWNGRALDVTAGVMPVRWGPGYVGGMMLSDAASSIPQIKIEKGFRLPGTFGHSIPPLAFTQLYGQFFEADDPTAPADARGTRRHFGARRLETVGSGRFQLALSEAFKSTRLPAPLVPQIVPYYQYQNDWTTSSRRRLLRFLASDAYNNTNWFNYFADISLSYRADGRGTVFYVDYALDDIKAPFGLGNPGNSTTPRKLGQQYGVFLPDIGGIGRLAARLEYVTTDRESYTNISPPVAWARDNVPLGFPGGPNARMLFGRLDVKISERAKVAFEGQTRRRGITLSNRNEPNASRFGFYSSYDLRRDVFLGARYEYEKITPQTGSGSKQSRFDFSVGAGF